MNEFIYNDSNGFKSKKDESYQNWQNIYGQGYQNSFATEIDSLFDQIMNYGDFSYDMEKDQLFQMYKQQYQGKGNQAMKNQLGVATASTGGYNSSFAQTSAQQAYQSSMDELNQKAADTYGLAMQKWQNEFDDLQNRYGTLMQAQQAEENSYYNRLNAAQQEFNTYNNLYNDDYNNQWSQYADNRNFEQTQANNAQNQANFDKQFNQNAQHNKNMENISKNAANGTITSTNQPYVLSKEEHDGFWKKTKSFQEKKDNKGMRAYYDDLVARGKFTKSKADDLYNKNKV